MVSIQTDFFHAVNNFIFSTVMKQTRLSILFVLIFAFSSHAFAQQNDSTSGVWKTQLGEVEFYVIQDRAGEINNNVFSGGGPEIDAAVKELAPSGKSPNSYNVFLLKKGSNVVLIDTGVGGDMLAHIEKLGIKPEQVQAVLLTHSHGDHVGGLLKNNAAVFPKATLWLAPNEVEYWKKSNLKQYENCEKAYKGMKMLPMIEGNLDKIPTEQTVVLPEIPELTTVELYGHTPGHAGFLVSTPEKTVFIVADLLHNSQVQFARPDISPRYDSDPVRAAEIRRKAMKKAAEEKYIFVGCHIPFPGAGLVKVNGDAFSFE